MDVLLRKLPFCPELTQILSKKVIFSKVHPYSISIPVSLCSPIMLPSFRSNIWNVFCQAIFLHFRMVWVVQKKGKQNAFPHISSSQLCDEIGTYLTEKTFKMTKVQRLKRKLSIKTSLYNSHYQSSRFCCAPYQNFS